MERYSGPGDYDKWLNGDHKCKTCQDSGQVPVIGKIQRKLPGGGVEEYDGIMASRQCPECSQDNRGKQLLEQSGIPANLASATFASYDDIKTETQSLALLAAVEYATNWPASKGDKAPLFHGSTGIGKSHLCVAMVKVLTLEKLVRCSYVNLEQYMNRRKDEFARKTTDDETKKILSAEVLFLDDIGTDRPTEFWKETLQKLVNECYTRGLPVVMTTNLSAKLIEPQMGPRAFSRVNEMCRWLTIDAPDHRLQKKGSR